jgi:Rrf2 family protein
MLSRTGEYALRAVLLLAARTAGGPVKADAIATELGLPRNYLSKTLHRLVKRGVLRSERGPHGGFRLARPATALAVSDVVGEFDELEGSGWCVMGGRACDPRHACPAHERWRTWSGAWARLMGETTVADFLGGNEVAAAEANGGLRARSNGDVRARETRNGAAGSGG